MTNRAKGWLIATVFNAGFWAIALLIVLEASSASTDRRSASLETSFLLVEPA